MAIPRGHRFPIEFDSAFPQGLVLVGEIAPDNEYQTREDKAAGRPVRQKIDQLTGKRQWKATVTDPDESTTKRAACGGLTDHPAGHHGGSGDVRGSAGVALRAVYDQHGDLGGAGRGLLLGGLC
jgi:hypothetical protein